MKQAPIKLPAERTEALILGDLATASEILLGAQQEIEAFEARRAAMLATESLDTIHALSDSHARAKLNVEIGESRLDALNEELKRLRVAELRARIEAAMSPLATIADEEREAVQAYGQHAKLVADALTRLQALQTRREEVSRRVHQISGRWVHPENPASGLAHGVKLPSATDGPDFWPVPYGQMLDVAARATRDAQALAEYHQENK